MKWHKTQSLPNTQTNVAYNENDTKHKLQRLHHNTDVFRSVIKLYIYKLGCLNECRDPVLRMAPVSRRALTPTFTFLHHHHQHHHHSHHSRRGHHHNHCHCKEKPMGSEWIFQWDNPLSVRLCVCTNWCLWNIWRGEVPHCWNPSGFHQRHYWRLQVERSNITNWRKYSEEKTGASSPAGVTPVAYTEYLLKQCVHLHQLVSLIFAEEIWHLHQLVNAIIWSRSKVWIAPIGETQ